MGRNDLNHSACSSHCFRLQQLVRVERQAIAQTVDRAERTRDLLARYGIACPTITGAGTGSFEFEAASGVYTELQCDSYIFMDADYGKNRDRDGGPSATFEPSLFVWATVMSRPACP